ncbi:MAG: hypothetical protein IPI35_07700 [Deltaproteobacteria bacterium]|nr:hypothetical protein [Deltaproteobacteria bacterium]
MHLQDDGHGVQVSFGPMPVALTPVERAEVASAFRLGATPLRLDGINIQLTREVSYRPPSAQVLDFGHYHARDWFHFPLASQVRDQAIRVGGIVWPDSEHFVQPDPRVRLPSAVYGYDEMSAWAMQLARSFREGELSGDELRECIYERLPRWPAPVSGAVGRARI